MIEMTMRALNLATMRAEAKLRRAYAQDGTTAFYPEQLVDDATSLEDALFIMRKLEDDLKVIITLAVKDGDTITYQGDVEGFLAQGEPAPGTMMSIRADMTVEWVEAMSGEA